MKRFITTALGISVFFVGLGAVIDKAAAGLKSDQKALDIIKRARTAIGGEAATAEFRSLVIKGRTSHNLNIDGVERTEVGETEIALQLPDKLMKMTRVGEPGTGDAAFVEKRVDVVVIGSGDNKVMVAGKDGEFTSTDGKKVIVRKADGAEWKAKEGDVKELKSADGKTVTVVRKGGEGDATFITKDGKKMVFDHKIEAGGHGELRQNELLRTTLGLLLTAPEGIDVAYTFGGDSNIEGTSVTSVVASFGGSTFRLYFDSSSYLPVGMSFVGHPAPVIYKFKKDGGNTGEKSDVVFTKKIDGPAEGVEHFVRFSDHRNVNGVQLPYKWTTSVGGRTTEVFDVTAYEVNPANIADRFKNQKVMVRTKRSDSN